MFETEILKSIIKPRVMYLRLNINKRTSFILLEPTCLHVKIYDCLLELQKTNRRMSIILIDCAIYSVVACA